MTPAQRAKAILDDALDSLASTHQQMREERAFCLRLEQYQNDLGNVRDRTRVQPRSQDPMRVVRYKAGQILKNPPYFKARAVDRLEDPKSAQRAAWALEHDISDPRKRYDIVRRMTVWAGLTSRVGCHTLGWNPATGPFGGDTEWGNVDGTHIAWEPPYTDPHDPRCGWFAHWEHMPLDRIRRMKGWKNTDQVTPDSGTDTGRPAPVNRTGAVNFDDSRGEREPMKTQRAATVLMLWERFGKYERPPSIKPLPESERFMVATAGPLEGQRVDYAPLDGGPLPEVDVLDDGTPLKRVDAVPSNEGALDYPQGLLTIVAPYAGAEPVELYRGPWPQKMRFFPYVVWQPYGSPFEQIGTSDVALNWTMVLAKNGTVRTWYEQLRASRGVMMLPERGLNDYVGEPFTYSDANGIQAFYTGAPPDIRYIQGPQPNPQIAGFLQYMGQELRAQEGTGDMALGGDVNNLKGINVGTIEQAAATGNVSVDDHIRSWQIEEAVGFNVLHDIQRARWTQERWVRYLGPEGVDAYERMQGMDIPAADIMISEKASLSALDADAIRAAMQLAELAQKSPALSRVVARRMGMDPEDVAEILGEAEQMRMAAEQAAMMKVPGAMGPPVPAAMMPQAQ